MTFPRITVRADQMNGVPCIRGLRIPAATMVGMIAEGMAAGEVIEATGSLPIDAGSSHAGIAAPKAAASTAFRRS